MSATCHKRTLGNSLVELFDHVVAVDWDPCGLARQTALGGFEVDDQLDPGKAARQVFVLVTFSQTLRMTGIRYRQDARVVRPAAARLSVAVLPRAGSLT